MDEVAEGARWRWALPTGLLGIEALAFSLALDLPVEGPSMPLVRALRVAVPVVLGAVVAAWVVDADDSRGAAASRDRPLPPWRPVRPLLLHLVAFAVTGALAWRDLGPGTPPPTLAAMVGLVTAAVVTVALAVTTAAPPRVALRLLATRWALPLAAIGFGVLSWWAAASAEALWGSLSRTTLRASGALLSVAWGVVAVDPAASRLALRGFSVTIAPVCSGADGMGLVVLFQALWLTLARNRVRFGRALLLLPAGALAALAANVVRIAALVSIGAAGHPDLAVGAFHSKLGWLMFFALALGTVAIAERHPWIRGADAARGPDRAAT